MAAAVGKEDRSIRLAHDQALITQPCDGFGNRDVCHSQAPGDIDGTGLAASVDKICNDLDVVFGDLAAVSLAGETVNACLQFGNHQRRGASAASGTTGSAARRRSSHAWSIMTFLPP